MTTIALPSRPLARPAVRRLTLGLTIAAIGAAGCGGSSSSSSSSATNSASSATSSSTPAAASQPLSKAAYEQQLGPLLNDKVGPGLRAALAHGGARDPQKLSDAISLLTTAHDQMAAAHPPTDIADVHNQAVAAIAALIRDVTKLRDAENGQDRTAATSAATAIKGDGQQLQSISKQFISRGY